MSVNFVSVNTGYQNRPGAPHARTARGGGNSTRPFREYLNEATQMTADYDKQAQVAVCSVCMNWLENRKIMSGKFKNSIASKHVSIVNDYYQAEDY